MMRKPAAKWLAELFVPGDGYVHKSRGERLKSQNVRIAWVVLAASLFFFLPLIVHMSSLQLNRSRMTEQLADPREFKLTLAASRGTIFDRNGQTHPLAVSQPIWRIFVDPAVIPDNKHNEIGNVLRAFGRFDDAKIDRAVDPETRGRYCVIGETADRQVLNALKTNTVFGSCLGVQNFYRRIYPYGQLMAHVIGIANASSNALDGIEYKFNRFLIPHDGKIIGVADAGRKEIRSRRKKKRERQNGANIYLTLDSTIQAIVEKHLDEAMAEYSPRRAWAIVQRPYTGEILAMASRPVFTRSGYGGCTVAARQNSAIKVNYDPGSIMKIAVFAAGLNEGIITPDSMIDCSDRLYAGRPLHDHIHGTVDATKALAKSSNRAASVIAEMLGRDRMDRYLRGFGFGGRTGIDLPGEESGILTRPSRLSNLQAIRMAIGQGISVTGIQMIGLYSTIANNGIRMKPYVVKAVCDSSTGKSLVGQIRPEVLSNPITPSTAMTLCSMMTNVIIRGVGTGWRGAVHGYNVAGKTGTAQIPGKGGYSDTDFWGSFVGFLPAESPEIVVLVTLEAPQPLHQGGTVAAPVFSKIAYDVARYLNIPTVQEMKLSGETYGDVRKRISSK